MSAPYIPAPSFESAPVAQLQQLKFDWHARAFVALGFSIELTRVGAAHAAPQHAAIAPTHYGPLHRRPPPSLS
jgi:hypothetical protein